MSNSNEMNPALENAMPTPATAQIKPISYSISTEKMADDTGKILKEFSVDYERMASHAVISMKNR